MTDPFSTLAYKQLIQSGKLGQLRSQVLWLYMHHDDLAPFEVVPLMKSYFNRGRGTSDSYRTRISELTNMGLLHKTGVSRTCPHSGAANNVWKWTGQWEPVIGKDKVVHLKPALMELTGILMKYDTSQNLDLLVAKLHKLTRL